MEALHRIVGRAHRRLGLVVIACALAFVPARSAAASSCTGSPLLRCSEKTGAYVNSVMMGDAFAMFLEPFETRVPAGFNDPSVRYFWRLEASSAAARSAFGLAITYLGTDQNFEQVATVPAMRRIVIRRSKLIDRSTATTLTALIRAEESEVAYLRAMDTSLNRAIEATYLRGRADWTAWQEAAAAGFARHASSSLGQVIRQQRAATAAFIKHNLLFGVGSEDLKLAQQQVAAHGLAGSIRGSMRMLGMTSSLQTLYANQFEQVDFGQVSFSLSQALSAADLIKAERGFQRVLNHFAGRIRKVRRPPR